MDSHDTVAFRHTEDTTTGIAFRQNNGYYAHGMLLGIWNAHTEVAIRHWGISYFLQERLSGSA